MKSVEVFCDFDYRPHSHWSVRFVAGVTYRRVIEAAALAIVRAGAGCVVLDDLGSVESGATGANIVDAFHAFDIRQRRR